MHRPDIASVRVTTNVRLLPGHSFRHSRFTLANRIASLLSDDRLTKRVSCGAPNSWTLKAVSPKHKCIAGGGSLNKAHLCRESEWESDRQDSVVIRGVKVRCRDLVSASDC